MEETGDDESQDPCTRQSWFELSFFFTWKGISDEVKKQSVSSAKENIKGVKGWWLISICPAYNYKGKAVVVEEREAYLAKTWDPIH